MTNLEKTIAELQANVAEMERKAELLRKVITLLYQYEGIEVEFPKPDQMERNFPLLSPCVPCPSA
jgi:hypothetical protein